MIGSTSATALRGMQAATQQASTAAHNTANANTAGFEAVASASDVRPAESQGSQQAGESRADAIEKSQREALSNVDVGTERVRGMVAAQAFSANLATLRAQDEATESLLNIRA